ncbi:MAG: hypothetical protein HYX69_09885 [Planctomycetia bacterium]|nr:hypothetical protein [Planctomycetia bacterium]
MTHGHALPRRVVKLGGSLLDVPGLAGRLRSWLARQEPAETLLIVGGGALADAIREADHHHGLPENVAHWLCIRAMAIQAELVRALLPEAVWLDSVAELAARPVGPRLAITDPWRFLREDEPRALGTRLPESWDVTSDSIAARLAEIVGAAELVLLKSALPSEKSIAELAAAGYVDRFFPQAAAGLECIRYVNFRDAHPPEVLGAATRDRGAESAERVG